MGVDIKPRLFRLNLDDNYNYLDKEDYVDALNITGVSPDVSTDITTSNIKGNRLVDYTLPAGTNVTIGLKEDQLRNRVYEFIWNSNAYHSILLYDNETRTRTKLIENRTDTNNVDVLEFEQNKKIIHVGIIYRDESEGDLVFWTDANVSPRKFNEKHISDGDYSVIKKAFIELAKAPPLAPPTAEYGSDTGRDANSLRKKLFQFAYRFVYDDFEKTTVSCYSKVPLPIGYYGSDNDIDSTKNNFITVAVETGDENVAGIEVLFRISDGNTWGDFLIAGALNKADLLIADNSTYDFLFYNDAIYPPLDNDIDVAPLFDWVPQVANTLCLPNGNVVDMGGIVENYDNLNVNDLDVTFTAENVTNVPPDTDPSSVTYTQLGDEFTFTVNGGNPPTGTTYKIYIFFNGNPGLGQTLGVRLVGDYTSIGGDTATTVAAALFADFNSFSATPPLVTAGPFGASWNVNFGSTGSYVFSIQVVLGPDAGGDISTEKTWLWKSNYLFGLVYEDEQNRDMPGVTTFSNPNDVDNDFMVTTPAFSLDGADVQTPVIYATINHLPPEGAVKYSFVRRRMTYSDFLFYETCDFQDPSDGFYYLCLANIDQYKEDNSQFIYGTAPITPDSRIQIIAGITGGAYDGDIWNDDYEILGLVTKVLSGGSAPDDERLFIKVRIPTTPPSPAYKENMLVMVYTPMSNPTDAADAVYWEWGETYDIYAQDTITYSNVTGGPFTAGETITGGTSGATATVISDDAVDSLVVEDIVGAFDIGESVTGGTSGASADIDSISTAHYHRGMDQDQTSGQDAEFTFAEGDVYFHQRNMYPGLVGTPPFSEDTLNIMDANFSDFFLSAVNDNGRAHVIAVNARQTYFPALDRFSLAYQENTSINQTNRFLFENFQDYDRSFGDIFKQVTRDRYKIVGQRYKIGQVPLFNQISRDSAGNQLLASTSSLLNPINYYAGNYGVGTSPESWVSYNNRDYFFDNVRGIWCRLSQDGITDISVLYKVNSFTAAHGVLRVGDSKIYGVYDSVSNYCIMAFEVAGDDPAFTLSFDETNNVFKSFLSYHPEMMCTLGTLLITSKNGGLWTHDSDTHNNFYGVQYESSVTPVFNQESAVKKTYNAIGYQSNQIWVSPTNGDVTTSNVNPQTGFTQESNIKSVDYDLQENVYVAAFNRDANSMSDSQLAVVEGDYLKGTWVRVKLTLPAASATGEVFLNVPYVTNSISQRNF